MGQDSNSKRDGAAATQAKHHYDFQTQLSHNRARYPRNRRWPRKTVRWVAQWMHPAGGECSGQVCDVSAKGFFMRPMTGETSELPVGTRLAISYAMPGRRDGLATVQGTVRWKGSSYSHQCPGFGIELDSEIDCPTGEVVPLSMSW